MKKEIFNEVEIPEGIEARVEGNAVLIKGQLGEIKREFNTTNVKIEMKENKIIIGCKKATKKEKKVINTITVHVKNMIKGVQEKFEYKLKAVFSHFPISIEVKGKEALVKNFLGEKKPRKVSIIEGVEVDVNGQEINISSINKELAGQTAANFEKATRIPLRDRRVFQDGIFITEKAGRKI